MSNPEAPVPSTILLQGLPEKGNIFDSKGKINAVPDEFPIGYRDNGLTVGGDIVRAHIEQETRKRIKAF